MTCPRCRQPMTEIHRQVTIDSYTGADRRLIAFLERQQHQPRAWDVYECRNQVCGCGCRRYQQRP